MMLCTALLALRVASAAPDAPSSGTTRGAGPAATTPPGAADKPGAEAPAPPEALTEAKPPEAKPPDEKPPEPPKPERKPPPTRLEADFLRGDTDLRVRFGFNGYTPGPFSLFTAFAGWQEFGIVLDHGVANWRSFTIGVGGDAHYGQAWLLGALTQQVANYDDLQFRWNMWEAGGNLRTTFHWTDLRGVDPYLFGAVGAGVFHLDARVKDWPRPAMQRIDNPYLRIEAGGGLLWRIPKATRFFVGAEARYLVTVQIDPQSSLDLTYDGQSATFDLFPQHKPPKGFSWIASVGVRF